MKKVVINKCFGGFSLSRSAIKEYAKLAGFELYWFKTDPEDHTKCIPVNSDDIKHENNWFLHCSKKPLNDGVYEDGAYFSDRDLPRDDETLVKVVEKLGEEANGACAELKIVEIPDDVEFVIEEYDGMEHIAEKHQTWG